MNPFDEFPRYKAFSWRTYIREARQWRVDWERTILEAMKKAETLDLFYELGESARTMVEESVREYLEEREE